MTRAAKLRATLAFAFAIPAAAALAQGTTIDHLGSGAALTGGELIPMWQNTNPAVSTTPAAIATYVNANLAPTINSGHTTVSGVTQPPGAAGPSNGLFLFVDSNDHLQTGDLFNDANGNLVWITSYSLSSLNISQYPTPPNNGFQVIGAAPTLALSAIAPTGSAAPQFVGQNAYCASPCSSPTQAAVQVDAVLVQLWGEGYNGSGYAEGGIITLAALQNWTGSANGAQWSFFVNPNGSTYGGGSLIETLDWANGLALNSQLTLNAATPSTSTGVSLGSTTVAASSCGSLSGASGCWKFVVGSTARYIPYY